MRSALRSVFRSGVRSAVRFAVRSAVTVFLIIGCDNSNAPKQGTIHVTVATTGVDLPSNDYIVQLDGTPGQAVGINADVSFSVAAGSRSLHLDGLPDNCTV